MCNTNGAQEYITNSKGRRRQGGKLVPQSEVPVQVGATADGLGIPKSAADVPLGSGQLDAARLAIKSRRARIAAAVGDD